MDEYNCDEFDEFVSKLTEEEWAKLERGKIFNKHRCNMVLIVLLFFARKP